MAVLAGVPTFVEVSSKTGWLIEQLQEPLRRALESRKRFYVVEIDSVGCLGEVMVSITSSRGRLPLIFGREDLQPGYVHRVVSDTVARFGL